MKTISMLVAVMMAAGALVLPLSMSTANADNTCKFTAENQRCDVDIKKLVGPFKLSIINEQNNGGGGSGGNASTVDQVARDAIAANDQNDVGITGNVTQLQSTIKSLSDELNQLTADFKTLNDSAITDISLSNGSAVVTPPVDNGTGGNGTVIEPPVEPPVDNGTVIEPPIDNGTGNNGSENNGTGDLGNFTG